MNKRRVHVVFITICIVLISGFVITYLHKHPPLWFYEQSARWRELPTRLIRPAFKHIMSIDLPPNIKGLRAIFRGYPYPTIYVKFEPDSNGITYILKDLGRQGAEWERFDENKLRSGREVFTAISIIQKEAGVCLFDQDSIKSGRLMSGQFSHNHKAAAYQIFITDEQQSTVYIGASM